VCQLVCGKVPVRLVCPLESSQTVTESDSESHRKSVIPPPPASQQQRPDAPRTASALPLPSSSVIRKCGTESHRFVLLSVRRSSPISLSCIPLTIRVHSPVPTCPVVSCRIASYHVVPCRVCTGLLPQVARRPAAGGRGATMKGGFHRHCPYPGRP